MTKVQNLFPLFYEIPTDTVLQQRKTFYSTQKETEEPITEWFYRIRSIIEYCDYGDFSNFLIIDKFFCGLDDDAKRWLRKTKTWSTDRLFQAITDPKFLNENANSEGVIVENRLEMDELLKVELDNVESAASFFNSNTDPSDVSDIEENNREPDFVKCEEEKLNDSPEISAIGTRNSGRIRAKNVGQKIKSDKLKNENEIKGCKKDGENGYICLDCGKRYKQKVAYNQHKRLHTGKNLQHCSICNKAFLKPSKLKKHFKKHEREQSVAGKSFECYLCKFQFLRVQGLRIHINVKHVSSIKSSNFQCEHCNGVFTQQMALDDHLRSEHQLNIPYKCSQCNREFQQLAEMKEHLATHSQLKPFMCEVCGNAFRTLKQLNLHMAKHTNERKFKCNECGQMLKSRSNYKTHMRKHTGERPFECNLCDKTFVQRANYLKHSRWHTGEKPHACTFCDKRFPTNYDMKLHVNSIHTGAKPFGCDLCDRKFSQPSTLRVHRLRVHR